MLLAISSINAITADTTASIALLRECITEAHLTTHGYRTLAALTRTVPTLVTIDPGFVRDLCSAAFRHHDESKDTTTMGDSKILPMTSHRNSLRQPV